MFVDGFEKREDCTGEDAKQSICIEGRTKHEDCPQGILGESVLEPSKDFPYSKMVLDQNSKTVIRKPYLWEI
eukprot:1026274-Amphidinium_carterae.1